MVLSVRPVSKQCHSNTRHDTKISSGALHQNLLHFVERKIIAHTYITHRKHTKFNFISYDLNGNTTGHIERILTVQPCINADQRLISLQPISIAPP